MADIEQINPEDIAKLEELQKQFQQLDDSKMPSTKDLMDMLDGANISEEMKENFRSMMTGSTPQVFGNYSTLLGILFAAVIFAILLFFGYKLYKSIKEKELKREEKKKAKLMKKKK